MDNSFSKTIIWSIGLFFGSVALFSVGMYFLSERIASQGEEIFKFRSISASYISAAQKLVTLKQAAPETEFYEKKINALIPVQDQLLNFNSYLDSVARRNQVNLTSSFQNGNVLLPSQNFGNMGFNFTVSGEFNRIQDFLVDLEEKTTGYWIGLESYDLVKNGETYSLQGQGKVFFR